MHDLAGHKTYENTPNYLSHFCYLQQNSYLTLLPSRTNLVNIALYECHQNYYHQMPDFSYKMHQIQFRLAPDPAGELTALPRPLARFGEGKEKDLEGRGGKREEGGEERGRNGKRRGRKR